MNPIDQLYKNLEIFRNTTKTFQLSFVRLGQNVDITGWTIYFTVKTLLTDTDEKAVIAKIITNHYDASKGKTLIALNINDTDRVGNFYYDIKYKDVDDKSGILFSGRITFKETVTNT
jgi:hypothetical protein